MAKKETFSKAMQLRISDEFIERIDNWQKLRGHEWSRSEAIRQLVELGMAANFRATEETEKILNSMEIFSASHPEKLSEFVEHYKDADDSTLSSARMRFYTLLENLDISDARMISQENDIANVREKIADIRKGCLEFLMKIERDNKEP
jgi:metal-responsive CopG/Arc/MetJ family transcriptional regulator